MGNISAAKGTATNSPKPHGINATMKTPMSDNQMRNSVSLFPLREFSRFLECFEHGQPPIDDEVVELAKHQGEGTRPAQCTRKCLCRPSGHIGSWRGGF